MDDAFDAFDSPSDKYLSVRARWSALQGCVAWVGDWRSRSLIWDSDFQQDASVRFISRTRRGCSLIFLRTSVPCSDLTPQTYVEFNNHTIATERIRFVNFQSNLDLHLGIQLGVVLLLGCPVCVYFSIEINRRISGLQVTDIGGLNLTQTTLPCESCIISGHELLEGRRLILQPRSEK